MALRLTLAIVAIAAISACGAPMAVDGDDDMQDIDAADSETLNDGFLTTGAAGPDM